MATAGTNTGATTNAAATTPAVRRASVPHSSLAQPKASQHLLNAMHAHKTRVHLHLPSTLPTLAHSKQVTSRIRKPAAPACLKEHSLTNEIKITKKVINTT